MKSEMEVVRSRRSVQQQLAVFAEEIICVLKFNTLCYSEVPFQIYSPASVCPTMNMLYFSENVKKAVFTLAYLFRTRCHDLYRRHYVYFKVTANDYQNLLMRHTTPLDRYFLRFLAWISFAFEMTMCCYREEYSACKLQPLLGYYGWLSGMSSLSFIDASKRCLVEYADMNVCIDRRRKTEWWEEVQKAANHIAVFHDTLVNIFTINYPVKDIFPPFQVALKNILKLKECKLRMTEINMSRDHPIKKYKRSPKLGPVFEYEPERISLGHAVARKNKLADKGGMSSTVSERSLSSEGSVQMESDLSASFFANVCRSREFEEYFRFDIYKNSAFVITEIKLKRIRERRDTCKRDIKIYLPSKEVMGKVENLYTLLEENIEKNYIEWMEEDLCLVDPVNARAGSPIIIMDSSTDEDDDDEFNSRQNFLMDNVLKKWKEFSLDDVEMMNFVLNSRIWEEPRPQTSANI